MSATRMLGRGVLRSCASVAALSLGLAAAGPAAMAQQDQQDPAGSADQGQTAAQQDALVATVDGTEIRRSDLDETIETLPPRLREQPAELLVPMALDSLILRELVLNEARAENLQEDEEVASLVQQTGEEQETAMVQVWLARELEERVSDDRVQQAYDELQEVYPDQEIPALEQVRPQVEQQVRQQVVAEIRSELGEQADVTLYGPEGEPLPEQSQAQDQQVGQQPDIQGQQPDVQGQQPDAQSQQ